ncbi:MAG: endonuclease domain-containing protein [Calditrichota bacterium]
MPRWQSVPVENWDRAKHLRHNLTPAERKLWARLKRSQLGIRFRRQHLIGPYIVDFDAPSVKLIIEIDGDSHAGDTARKADQKRTDFLNSLGYRVQRYSNCDIEQNIDSVLKDIWENLK